MDAKTKAIVSHLFVIGWIIALIVNSSKKEELASFYIRQNLGFIIVWLALTILRVLPVVGPVIWAVGGILLFVGWLMSNAKGYPVSVFGLFNLPTLIAKNEPLAHTLGEMHETGAAVFVLLLVLHVVGAVYHKLKTKDDVLSRMSPF